MSRMSVKLGPKADRVLENLREETGKSKTELIRTAIALLDHTVEKKKDGGRLVIIEDGKIEQEIILP